MSKTLNELYEEILKDENLQKQLGEAVKSNNKESISSFLCNNGCDASISEAKAFLEKKGKEIKEDGELTPEQLEAVNGGTVTLGISTAIGTAFIGLQIAITC